MGGFDSSQESHEIEVEENFWMQLDWKKIVFMFEADLLQHEGGKNLYLILGLLTKDLEEKGCIHVQHEIEGVE